MVELLLLPAVYLGVIIGLYEIFVFQRDVQVPVHKFNHAVQAFIVTIILTFISMNIDWVLAIFPVLKTIPYIQNALILRIIIGLIAVIKIHAISAAVSGKEGSSIGMKEKLSHSLIIGVLIVASPYIWPFINPFIAKYLPV